MAIGTQYKTMATNPGMVLYQGLVIVSGTAIVAAETHTPGVTATRLAEGEYRLAFDDGVAIGFVAATFADIINSTGEDPLSIALLGASDLQPGSTELNVELSDGAGNQRDPSNGFSYTMARMNTSVVVP